MKSSYTRSTSQQWKFMKKFLPVQIRAIMIVNHRGCHALNIARGLPMAKPARPLPRMGRVGHPVCCPSTTGMEVVWSFRLVSPVQSPLGLLNRNGNTWNYSIRGPQMDLVSPSGNANNTGDVRTTDRPGNNGYANGDYVTTFGGSSAA